MASAPSARVWGGSRGWKPRWAPQAWSTITAAPASWAIAAIARDVAHDADEVRLDEENGTGGRALPGARPVSGRAGRRARARSRDRRPGEPRPARGLRARGRRGATCGGSARRPPLARGRRRERERLVSLRRAVQAEAAQIRFPQSSAASRSACPRTSPVRWRSSAPPERGRSQTSSSSASSGERLCPGVVNGVIA